MNPACIHFYQLLFLVFYFSSETSVFTYQTVLLYISENRNFHTLTN